MHLSFSHLLHPKIVSVTHSPCYMYPSFSHILYRTLRLHSHQLAVCTFHFHTSYTTVYRPHRARWLYAPFIFRPLTPCLDDGLLSFWLYIPSIFRLLTPIEHRVHPQHAMYASSILVVEGLFLC